jgi:hypothetical protein
MLRLRIVEMIENNGATLVRAVSYIRDACAEVVAVSNYLQERFTNRKAFPDDYSCVVHWPTRSIGRFFDTYQCLIKIKKRRSYWGCVSYLFDLGGNGTFATKRNRSLVVTAWTGGNHTEENQYYWVDNDLHSLPDEHVDWFNKGLWCWREEEGDPKPRPGRSIMVLYGSVV